MNDGESFSTIPVMINNRPPCKQSCAKPCFSTLENLVQIRISKPDLTSSSDDFMFALLNIRSLSSKCWYVNDLISDFGLQFLFLTECWLSSTASATLIEACPPGYSFLFSAREEKRGGGIAAIFSNDFTCTKCSFGDFLTFEYLSMVIKAQEHILV